MRESPCDFLPVSAGFLVAGAAAVAAVLLLLPPRPVGSMLFKAKSRPANVGSVWVQFGSSQGSVGSILVQFWLVQFWFNFGGRGNARAIADVWKQRIKR